MFWTGHGMELFLGDALETLATKAVVVELADAPGIELLPVREAGRSKPICTRARKPGTTNMPMRSMPTTSHAHDEHGEGDMHFWLDPENAKLMVTQIAATLAEADPDNATTYQANAEAELVKLDDLEADLTTMLAPVVDKPFVSSTMPTSISKPASACRWPDRLP